MSSTIIDTRRNASSHPAASTALCSCPKVFGARYLWSDSWIPCLGMEGSNISRIQCGLIDFKLFFKRGKDGDCYQKNDLEKELPWSLVSHQTLQATFQALHADIIRRSSFLFSCCKSRAWRNWDKDELEKLILRLRHGMRNLQMRKVMRQGRLGILPLKYGITQLADNKMLMPMTQDGISTKVNKVCSPVWLTTE